MRSVRQVVAQRTAFEQRGTGAAQLAVFDAFLAHVVPVARDAGIAHVPLLRMLSRPTAPMPPPPAVTSARTASAPVPVGAADSASARQPSGVPSGDPGGSAPARKRPVLRLRSAPAALPQQAVSDVDPTLSHTAPVAARTAASSRPPTPVRNEMHSAASPLLTANAAAAEEDRAAPVDEASEPAQAVAAGTPESQSLAVADAHITLLLNAGVLARHPLESHAYLFSVPTTGPLVRSIAKGRAEVRQRPDH